MAKIINNAPLESLPFVKSRDLVGKTFEVVSALRQGETKLGESYYLDVLVDGERRTLGIQLTSAMGKQVARDESSVSKGTELTVVIGKASEEFPDHPPFLLATP